MNMRKTLLAGAALMALTGALTFVSPAQAATATASSKSAHHYYVPGEDKGNFVEYRIKKLHDAIGVTSEQEDDWNNVASTMRESGEDMHKMMMERRENRADSDAIESLKSYKSMAEAHVSSMDKFIDAFEPFYDKLSDGQKLKADEFFRKPMMGHDWKGMKKPADKATK